MFVSFNYTSIRYIVFFNNYSLASGENNWEFGVGETSNLKNPIHTYPTSGEYTVVLTVTTSDNCIAADTIQVLFNPSVCITNASMQDEIAIFPNPFADVFYIMANHSIPIAMWDLIGNIVEVDLQQIEPDKYLVAVTDPVSGLYILELQHYEHRKYFLVNCVAPAKFHCHTRVRHM